MSKNCIKCVVNTRTGLDLLCDECRVYDEAVCLAKWLHARQYRESAPQWMPLNDTRGVLSQIDNMVAGVLQRLESSNADAQRLANAITDWKASQGLTKSGDLLDDALEAHEARLAGRELPPEYIRVRCGKCGWKDGLLKECVDAGRMTIYCDDCEDQTTAVVESQNSK